MSLPKNFSSLKNLVDVNFNGCVYLEGKVELPESVENLKSEAFEDCKMVTAILAPGLKGLGDSWCRGCERLKIVENNTGTYRIAYDKGLRCFIPYKEETAAKVAVNGLTLRGALHCWLEDKEEATKRFGHISDWDVSEVTSFKRLFEGKKDFNEDLSRWDVSMCTDMSGMFEGCSAFNSDLSKWNTSNCTNMGGMFVGCSAFNCDLSTWNTSNCTNMEGMFYGCSAFNSDLSRWKTSKCTKMSDMFENATSFNSDLSQWNMSKVENKRRMFLNATAMKASHKPKGV